MNGFKFVKCRTEMSDATPQTLTAKKGYQDDNQTLRIGYMLIISDDFSSKAKLHRLSMIQVGPLLLINNSTPPSTPTTHPILLPPHILKQRSRTPKKIIPTDIPPILAIFSHALSRKLILRLAAREKEWEKCLFLYDSCTPTGINVLEDKSCI